MLFLDTGAGLVYASKPDILGRTGVTVGLYVCIYVT